MKDGVTEWGLLMTEYGKRNSRRQRKEIVDACFSLFWWIRRSIRYVHVRPIRNKVLCCFTGKRIVHRIPGVQYLQNDRSNDGAYNNQKNDGCEEGFMKKTDL